MNYMEQVAKMLGVEMGEWFEVDGNKGFKYWFKKDGIHDQYAQEQKLKYTSDALLNSLLSGKRKIVKKPFVPENGKFYFYVTSSGNVVNTRYADSAFNDVFRKMIGDCYRTEEEAKSHVKEWKAFFEGEPINLLELISNAKT